MGVVRSPGEAAVHETVDGRTARAVRTRAAVVDALLSLIDEGDLRPTALRVAERAGVSLRSVFQHFDDMETLFAAVAARQGERLLSLARVIPVDLPRPARIAAFSEYRAGVFEFMTPVRRAGQLQEPFSAELRAANDRLLAVGRDELLRTFAPELAPLTPAERGPLLAALELAATWTTWETLRTDAGLGVDAARRVMARTITALLAAACPDGDGDG